MTAEDILVSNSKFK